MRVGPRHRTTLLLVIVATTTLALACGQPAATPTAAPTATPTPAAPKLAYIANVSDPTITVVDLDKAQVVNSISFRELKGKQQGHFISVSADSKYIWIAEDISNDGGYVQVLNAETGEQVKRWDVGAGVANYLTRDGKYLFTSSTKTRNINVFDVANQQHLGDFPIGAAPHVIDTSPDGKTLWTTDSAGGNLRSFDITGLPSALPTPLDTIAIGGTLHAVLVHPNGKYVLVGSDKSGDNIVDVATKKVIAAIPGKPHNYEVSPDRKYLLSGETDYPTCDELKDLSAALAGSKGPLLRFVNIATLNGPAPDLSTVKTEKWLDASGLGPASISHQVYDPSGKTILVTTYRHKDGSPNGEGQLLFVNADTLKVERTLEMPTRVHAIAFPGHNR